MIVYVESNFILEVALEQEQFASAEAILKLVEENKIKLAFPSFALSEPFATVMRRDKERSVLIESLTVTLRQLQRSEPDKQIALVLQPLLVLLQDAKDAVSGEFSRLHSTVARLLKIGTSIELDESTLEQAKNYQRLFNLKPQDSIIYSTIIADMQRRPHGEMKCFLSRDRKAFSTNPGIRSELASYNGRYIGNFAQGLSFIQHEL